MTNAMTNYFIAVLLVLSWIIFIRGTVSGTGAFLAPRWHPTLHGGWAREGLPLLIVLTIEHGSTLLNEWAGDEAALAATTDQ